MSIFPCNHLVQTFKPLKFWYDFSFSFKFTQWTHTCFEQNMFFLVQKVWINLHEFLHSVWLLKKWSLKQLIYLVFKSQKDIYIISKIILKYLWI
jgi:hypothetical protein